MTKTKMILLVSFVVVFAAGATVGLLIGRPSETPRRRSRISSDVALTPEQREQMRTIWSELMRATTRQYYERRQGLQKERDEAALALLTEDQRERHEELMQEYEQKFAELAAERNKAFEEATERTKAMLTEPQRKKYEELMQHQRSRWSRYRRGTGRQADANARHEPGDEQ